MKLETTPDIPAFEDITWQKRWDAMRHYYADVAELQIGNCGVRLMLQLQPGYDSQGRAELIQQVRVHFSSNGKNVEVPGRTDGYGVALLVSGHEDKTLSEQWHELAGALSQQLEQSASQAQPLRRSTEVNGNIRAFTQGLREAIAVLENKDNRFEEFGDQGFREELTRAFRKSHPEVQESLAEWLNHKQKAIESIRDAMSVHARQHLSRDGAPEPDALIRELGERLQETKDAARIYMPMDAQSTARVMWLDALELARESNRQRG